MKNQHAFIQLLIIGIVPSKKKMEYEIGRQMICQKCESENVNVQAVTEHKLVNKAKEDGSSVLLARQMNRLLLPDKIYDPVIHLRTNRRDKSQSGVLRWSKVKDK